MTLLLVGLLLFIGVHSARIFAEDFRSAQILRFGEKRWKGLYSLASIVGFVLIVWGYGLARQQPVVLWPTPTWLRHLAAPLTLLAFILVAAAYVPANGIKARLRHPMVLGVKVWALAHLAANNTLADLLLFGSFLVWAVLSYRAARARDRATGATGATTMPANASRTLAAVVVGGVAWAGFTFWAHAAWIGVRPLA